MTIRIGDMVPNFTADTTEGKIEFHSWINGGWTVFFSHPKDFTPICTTELGLVAKMQEQFDKRGTKIIGHSIDPVEEHFRWMKDIEETQGCKITFPIIGDDSLEVAKLFEMLPAEAVPGKRTPVDNATVRAVFIVGPDKKIKAISFYPATCGRNFDEVLRAIDSLQLTEKFNVVTPANWEYGDDVVIPPSVSDEQARKLFPDGWKADRPYLRVMTQPTDDGLLLSQACAPRS